MRARIRAAVAFFGILVTAAAVLAQPAALAQDDPAIRRVILDQMSAFQRDDGTAAFGYASPGIQALFQTPERFMTMVRDGYRPVYRPRSVRFLDLVETPLGLVQRVLVTGPDGVPVIADYSMERQPDGTWRISGCRLLAAPDASV